MFFSTVTNNPEEALFSSYIVGLILSQGLDATELAVLGRLIIDVGEVLVTLSVLLAAREAEEKTELANNNSETAAKGKTDTTQTDPDSIQAIIRELQQQNQYLQKQIWDMQEVLSRLKNN